MHSSIPTNNQSIRWSILKKGKYLLLEITWDDYVLYYILKYIPTYVRMDWPSTTTRQTHTKGPKYFYQTFCGHHPYPYLQYPCVWCVLAVLLMSPTCRRHDMTCLRCRGFVATRPMSRDIYWRRDSQSRVATQIPPTHGHHPQPAQVFCVKKVRCVEKCRRIYHAKMFLIIKINAKVLTQLQTNTNQTKTADEKTRELLCLLP